jgi:hypothetical protein
MEDHSSSDFRRATPPSNQVWVLPRHEEGAENLILFADTGLDEPTGRGSRSTTSFSTSRSRPIRRGSAA